MKRIPSILLLAVSLILLLMACSTMAEEVERTPAPVPTSHPFFGDVDEADQLEPLGAEQESGIDSLSATEAAGEEMEPEEDLPPPLAVEITPETGQPGPADTTTIPATPTPQLDIQLSGGGPISATDFYTVTIFDEELNEHWTIDNSQWVTITLDSDIAYRGDYSLAWHPYEDFASVFFTVGRHDNVAYLRPQVIGIRFWLSGGENWVERDDLAITAIGSNQYPYWVPNDYSVQSRLQPIFSETRLEFLNLNRDIPPGEWAPIILLLNDLQFDPPYFYLTGFYLKNDRGVLHPLYLDNVELVMVREEGASES